MALRCKESSVIVFMYRILQSSGESSLSYALWLAILSQLEHHRHLHLNFRSSPIAFSHLQTSPSKSQNQIYHTSQSPSNESLRNLHHLNSSHRKSPTPNIYTNRKTMSLHPSLYNPTTGVYLDPPYQITFPFSPRPLSSLQPSTPPPRLTGSPFAALLLYENSVTLIISVHSSNKRKISGLFAGHCIKGGAGREKRWGNYRHKIQQSPQKEHISPVREEKMPRGMGILYIPNPFPPLHAFKPPQPSHTHTHVRTQNNYDRYHKQQVHPTPYSEGTINYRPKLLSVRKISVLALHPRQL